MFVSLVLVISHPDYFLSKGFKNASSDIFFRFQGGELFYARCVGLALGKFLGNTSTTY